MASGMQMPQDTLFALGVQAAAGADEYARMVGGFESPQSTVHYFPLMESDLGLLKNQEVLPDELGGKALPFGSFVTGVWGGGTTRMIARLGNRLGWVLLATLGACSTQDDHPVVGVNTHIFTFADESEFFIPWLTLYKLLPHADPDERVGLKMQDGRIAALTLNAAAGAPVDLELALTGRRFQDSEEFEVNPGWEATYDDLTTFAVATCDGHFKIGTTEFKVTNLTMNFVNDLLPAPQSMYIGSIDPLDFPNLSRNVTVTATILLEDYDLYLSTFAGEAVDATVDGDQEASCTIYKGDLDVMLASAVNIGATEEAYKLHVLSSGTEDNVAWQIEPIRVVPRQPVVMQATANFEAVTAGTALRVMLENATANYQVNV